MNFIKTLPLVAALLAGATPSFAQDAGNLTVELNTVAQTESACRLTYVATNMTNEDLKNASYEVAVFNERGAVSKMLILEFGAIKNGSTRVVQFDIDGQQCDDISRILVNNQVDCATDGGSSNACLENLAATTLDTDIEFVD